MFNRARTFWALIMLCAFASAAGAQMTAPTANLFSVAPRTVDQSDIGSMLSNLYLTFDPDTVAQFGITVVVVDSVDAASPDEIIIDVTGRWNGAIHTERQTVHIDAEFTFPHTAGGDGGFPDSVFKLTWDKPGDGDRYTYQSRPATGPALDVHSLGAIGVTHAESEIHEGNMYEAGIDGQYSVNDTIIIGFVLPDNGSFTAHIQGVISTSGGAHFNLVKGDSVSGGTDTLAIYNVNFCSDNTAEIQVYSGAVASETGDELPGVLLGAGQGTGGVGTPQGEYIWCGGTHKHHLMRFVSLANSNRVTIRFRWSENKGR